VKCDEGKPSCNRCIKFGATCDGYGSKKSDTPPATATRTLIPKSSFPLVASPSQNLFDLDNPEEWTYFQRFCNYTVNRLSGLRESDFWSRVVLQATQSEPSIRHAATAIGALDLQVFTRAGDEDVIKFRHQFAYKEYQKAIVGMRKALSEKDCDIRTRLIACILFACFEAYHGNCEVALVQIFSGIEMMEEHNKKRKKEDSTSNGPRLPPVDPELVQALVALEIQATAWGDSRPCELHLERMKDCAAAVESGMPFEFSRIKHAVVILALNMTWGIHLRFSQAHLVRHEGSIVPPFVGLGPCANEPAAHELNRCLASFKVWSAAFEPLYRKARSAAGEKIFEAATQVRMDYLGGLAWVASGSPSIGMYYRRYTKELKEIVALSKVLLDIGDSQIFSLEMRFVLPLAVVGLNYRHRAMRQECIRILTPMSRREAIWDASMMGRIMSFQAEIEEEGLDDDEEYVPEDGMSTIVHLKVDESTRTVFITCSVGIRGRPGESVTKRTELVW
jgi:hypothetical protein